MEYHQGKPYKGFFADIQNPNENPILDSGKKGKLGTLNLNINNTFTTKLSVILLFVTSTKK